VAFSGPTDSTARIARRRIIRHVDPHNGSSGRPVSIIGIASSAGAEAPGQEKAPQALRDAGLVRGLRDGGLRVEDAPDTPSWRWRPDRDRRHAQNLDVVVSDARTVEQRVRDALALGMLPLVLGGGCSLELGTVAGHLPDHANLALLYFDLHADLNVPNSVTSGSLDWMGTAHIIGEQRAVEELRSFGRRDPLLAPEQLLLFALDPTQSTPWEREVLERRGLHSILVDEVAADPEAAAARALAALEPRCEHLLVHFDVDVIDFTDAPLSENPGQNIGLALDIAMRALRCILSSPKLSALTVTELNPDHGAEDGSTLARFVAPLVEALAGAPVLSGTTS
jgi:arginase